MRPRLFAVAIAAGLVLAGCQPEAPLGATPDQRTHVPSQVKLAPPPPRPDLSGYPEVPADDYLVTEQYTKYVSFQTPDGLTCRIDAVAGCDGPLHGTSAPANEVALGGFVHTSTPRFSRAGGSPPKTLPAGHKIVHNDLQCAVATGAITICTQGSPATGWFVLSATHSGIGPRSVGLPDRFPTRTTSSSMSATTALGPHP